jgi:putative transposase
VALKYKVILTLSSKYPITALCKMLGVSRGGYYSWLQRSRTHKVDKDEGISKLIRTCQEATYFTYGYRRVVIWLLRETGLVINHKAVLRIMNKYSLCARIRRRRTYRCIKNAAHKYVNLLARNFTASEPNQRWVTDITQFPTKDGVLYASVIKDLYDGSIVSYATSRDQTINLVLKTVREAVARVGDVRTQLILHSDQGAQYTSDQYSKELAAARITPSMSNPGTPLDNAAAESFFSSMKTEWVRNTSHMNYNEVSRLIEDYISFYNNVRIRLSSKTPPMEKRRKVA